MLNPDSKRKGKTVLIVSGICLVLSIIGYLVILAISAAVVDAASYYGYIGQMHLLG